MPKIIKMTDEITHSSTDGILDIIERDYIVQRRCAEELAPGMRCGVAEPLHPNAMHAGDHYLKAPNGSRVAWS